MMDDDINELETQGGYFIRTIVEGGPKKRYYFTMCISWSVVRMTRYVQSRKT